MGLGRVVLVRRAIADVAVQDDDGGAALRLPEDLEGVLDAIHVVGVAHAQHIPSITQEPRGHVLGEREACASFDGDVIVVVDPAQVVEAQVARQRCRFRRDALHLQRRENLLVGEIAGGSEEHEGRRNARWSSRIALHHSPRRTETERGPRVPRDHESLVGRDDADRARAVRHADGRGVARVVRGSSRTPRCWSPRQISQRTGAARSPIPPVKTSVSRHRGRAASAPTCLRIE